MLFRPHGTSDAVRAPQISAAVWAPEYIGCNVDPRVFRATNPHSADPQGGDCNVDILGHM